MKELKNAANPGKLKLNFHRMVAQDTFDCLRQPSLIHSNQRGLVNDLGNADSLNIQVSLKHLCWGVGIIQAMLEQRREHRG